MHTIWVNEKSVILETSLTISQLLEKIESPTNGIAVAVNNQVHSQEQWNTVMLQNNDKVLIIQATQGG